MKISKGSITDNVIYKMYGRGWFRARDVANIVMLRRFRSGKINDKSMGYCASRMCAYLKRMSDIGILHLNDSVHPHLYKVIDNIYDVIEYRK